MSIPVATRPTDMEYMGNRNKKEVHDLKRETLNCQIDEIILADHAVVFTPDTLDQAHREGFDDCGWCLMGSGR